VTRPLDDLGLPPIAAEDLTEAATRLRELLAPLAGGRLLITGGAGFLGYYLVQLPLAWNRLHPDAPPISVTVHDNFLRGLPSWLEQLQGADLTAVERDVLQPLPSDEEPFDHVIHAASVASPTYYRRYPIETMDANVGGLRLLLDHAAARASTARPVQHMLYFSTSEIYGDPDPDHIPTSEAYRGSVSCTGPRACYDESKRFGETLCVNFAAQRGVPVTTARPFNNYGPGLRIDDARLVPDLARDILAGDDLRLLSDGSATRTFCYVMDAVEGYYRILLRGRPGEAYNIGNDEPEISVLELARRMAAVSRDLTGYRGDVVHEVSDDPEYLTDNPNRRCPVIAKARHELDFEPRVALDDGLHRTLRWYLETGEQ
jgi:UDP-glucuronate decarboxylase